ncbi:MAG: hypothetical protein CSA18_00345 [Deltaproteobacteria bacterium]|nr:MAG: hypothetical protein CSA18_00345 [Deltaproteobacteria bacterium]
MKTQAIFEFTNCAVKNFDFMEPFSLKVNKGEICLVESDNDKFLSVFFQALATLIPLKGEFFFQGERIDLSDYTRLISLKRKIGFLGPSYALLSNRSLIENLQLMRLWEEDSLEISMDDDFIEKCNDAGIYEFLHSRPAGLSEEIQRGTFIVREFLKMPEIFLLETPYLFARGKIKHIFKKMLRAFYEKNIPVVYYSKTGFIPDFGITHIIKIKNNKIEKRPVL